MKTWTEDHLWLARAAVEVRDGLRALAARLPNRDSVEASRLATMLTIALKARSARRREVQK